MFPHIEGEKGLEAKSLEVTNVLVVSCNYIIVRTNLNFFLYDLHEKKWIEFWHHQEERDDRLMNQCV